jgi:hypothetical protein
MLAFHLSHAAASPEQPGIPSTGNSAATGPVSSLEGTTWDGKDSRGEYYEYTFLKGGKLRYRSYALLGSNLETTEGKGNRWKQDRANVVIKVNDYITLAGTIAGAHMRGNASNRDGDRWTWDAREEGAKPDAADAEPPAPLPTGPAETIDITLQADGRYSWRGKSWRAGPLQAELFQESHLHPISEIRLLDPHQRMSVANAIEIAQMNRVVGAQTESQQDASKESVVAPEPVADSAPEAANPFPFEYANRTLMLPVPEGSCAIPRESEQGKQLYKMLEDSSEGGYLVALMFADCAEWKLRERDPNYRMRNFGDYLIHLVNGKEVIVPVETSRPSWVKARVGVEDVAAIEKTAGEKLQAAATAGASSPAHLGMLTYDEDAMYFGQIFSKSNSGEGAHGCNVSAMTEINQIPIAEVLHGDYVDPGSIRALLATLKVNLKALVAANAN